LGKFKVYNVKLRINKIFKILVIVAILIFIIKSVSTKVQAFQNGQVDNSGIMAANINKVSPESLKEYFGKTLAIFSLNDEEKKVEGTEDNEGRRKQAKPTRV